MVVDEVCQIFGVGVEFLRSQYRSLRHTAVDCARAHYVSVSCCYRVVVIVAVVAVLVVVVVVAVDIIRGSI